MLSKYFTLHWFALFGAQHLVQIKRRRIVTSTAGIPANILVCLLLTKNSRSVTSTAERSFSALRRIKTYLRTSMNQARLNHCMLLHVLRDKTDELNDCQRVY